MSASALGGKRVGSVMSRLWSVGYRCARTSASGQRRGARREEMGLAGDIIALATLDGYPHLIIEVGGVGKRLGKAFAELRESLAPGFAAIVVRYVDRKSWWYVDEDTRCASIGEAIDAIRNA